MHLAAVRQATNCRNLPRNLPRACRRAYYREQAARLPAAAHAAVALPPRNYHKKATAGTPVAVHAAGNSTVHTAEELPQKTTAVCYRRAYHQGILPCDGSRAQRAGDSDVGANDKGAGDDPGDWVDAH